jgi:hypothetical protein
MSQIEGSTETSKSGKKKWSTTLVSITIFIVIAITLALILVFYRQQRVIKGGDKSLTFSDRLQPLSQHPFIDLNAIELTPSDRVLLSSPKQPVDLACHLPPDAPGDRRKDRDLLRIVNFNPEWLFQFGGRGMSRCPGKGCSWKV